MITEKACSKCKEVKAVSEFSKSRIYKNGTQGYSAECKKCVCIRTKIYIQKNIEKVRIKRKELYQKNKINIAIKQREYKLKKYIENNNIYKIEYKRRKETHPSEGLVKSRFSRKSISDVYIRKLFIGSGDTYLKTKDIPQELIEAKRMQIKLHRLIKELR